MRQVKEGPTGEEMNEKEALPRREGTLIASRHPDRLFAMDKNGWDKTK